MWEGHWNSVIHRAYWGWNLIYNDRVFPDLRFTPTLPHLAEKNNPAADPSRPAADPSRPGLPMHSWAISPRMCKASTDCQRATLSCPIYNWWRGPSCWNLKHFGALAPCCQTHGRGRVEQVDDHDLGPRSHGSEHLRRHRDPFRPTPQHAQRNPPWGGLRRVFPNRRQRFKGLGHIEDKRQWVAGHSGQLIWCPALSLATCMSLKERFNDLSNRQTRLVDPVATNTWAVGETCVNG